VAIAHLIVGNEQNLHLQGTITISSGERSIITASASRSPVWTSVYLHSLLQKGINIQLVDNFDYTALHYAAARGYDEVVRMLLAANARLDALSLTVTRKTPIACAAEARHLDTMTILLDSIKEGSREGVIDEALVAAAGADRGIIVRELLQMGANANAHDPNSRYGTALQGAASYRNGGAVVQLLLDYGAKVNALGGVYGTALQAAAYRGSFDIAKLLLENGADVNIFGGIGGTALHATTAYDHFDMTKLLLERGADINATGWYYGSALQAAAGNDHFDMAKLLLDRGADINATGGHYGSALRAAKKRRHKKMAEMLIEAGALPTEDVEGSSGLSSEGLSAVESESDSMRSEKRGLEDNR
jgi:ankyrin repeat protein